MIKKIKQIKNLAVFQDFNWDTEIVDSEGNPLEFKKINIIYGRNYSGKTTISRIIRAMEVGKLSDKYENPECCVCIDEKDISQNNFTAHDKTIRVFNEDFIKKNLKFIINQDGDIESFSILGEHNNKIEADIRSLREQLGLDTEGKETALYKELKTLDELYTASKNAHSEAAGSLESQIKLKAIDRTSGIKYQVEKFGDQNYNAAKLKDEIKKVLQDDFTVISDEQKKQMEDVLSEQVKPTIEELPALSLNLKEYCQITNELITRKIGRSDKIDELVKNAVLNRWVKEGRDLHKEQRTICAFCNSTISDERWQLLDRHFDEKSNELEKDISSLLAKIIQERESIAKITCFKKDDFYKEFHSEIALLSTEYLGIIENYRTSLEHIEKQLNDRKDDILNEKVFEHPEDYSKRIQETRTKFEQLRKRSNDYTDSLDSKQREAKETLRLKEVYDFVQVINYNDLKKNIETLATREAEAIEKRDNKQEEIEAIRSQIISKQNELRDETKGADKVNEYLNDFFGHNFLSLKAIETEPVTPAESPMDYKIPVNNGKSLLTPPGIIPRWKFEIQRNNKKAYHLSEGECSLIAFCYFMAKLQDIETKSKKPIIWIDDPISSLDSNHIFFMYSLINTEIFPKEKFEQLFISTHNLEFLKFLKRLPGINHRNYDEQTNKTYRYLIIERTDQKATIKLMPNYLREYVTEFNYLFKQIYQCSQIEKVTDENYTVFYNFGNNARKFLEIFLFYKYPDSRKDIQKMKLFFGDKNIPAVLTDRINNEYSHLSGVFERGSNVVEVPEMNKAAKLIIERIKKDTEQYNALLRSIGELDNKNKETTNERT